MNVASLESARANATLAKFIGQSAVDQVKGKKVKS